jgi:hypothetical protein
LRLLWLSVLLFPLTACKSSTPTSPTLTPDGKSGPGTGTKPNRSAPTLPEAIRDLKAVGISDANQKIIGLMLRGEHFADAGLKELAVFKHLKVLTVEKAEVTTAGVSELKKALPNCKIVVAQ